LKGLFVLIALCALLLIPTTNFAFAQVSDFYWSSGSPNRDVFTADAATKTVSPVTNGGFSRIGDVELDPLANKVWWNNWVIPSGQTPTEGIWNSNPDGSAQTQITGAAQSSSQGGFGSGHHGLVLDPANQKVFFTRGVSYDQGPPAFCGEVSVVDMTGLNYMQLNSPGAESWFPSGIDLVGNTLYWGQPGVLSCGAGDGVVNSMDTSGGMIMPSLVAPSFNGDGRSIAVDSAKGLLFYSSHDISSPGTGGAIYVYDLVNGGLPTQVLLDPQTGIPDIELDTANMILYWTDYARGEIRSASYDAAGTLGQITTEIANQPNAFGLALAFEEEPKVVGGEFLSIDNTALMLAGIQSLSVWMIPTLAGIAGAGFYLVKLRRN
jgi:hypothetical protein